MIYRVRHGATVLDFGSMAAIHQFLDNYPPHIRERVLVKEANSEEIKASVAQLSTDLQRSRRDNTGDLIETPHTEWLLSRIEFYSNALPAVEQAEAQLREKEAARVAQTWEGGQAPVVNEVWRP